MNLDLLEGEIVEDFEIREKIYEGVLSQVHIVRHLPTNSFCISKIYDLSKQSKENLKHITHEIVTYMNTNHPNICRMLSFAKNYKKKDIFIGYQNVPYTVGRITIEKVPKNIWYAVYSFFNLIY